MNHATKFLIGLFIVIILIGLINLAVPEPTTINKDIDGRTVELMVINQKVSIELQASLEMELKSLYSLVTDSIISVNYFIEICQDIEYDINNGYVDIAELDTLDYICYSGSDYADCDICYTYKYNEL